MKALKADQEPGSFAGLSLDRPLVMGIVNVTPDSFSDGGDFASAKAAIDHGLRLADEGADIIDVGGESTRPGADVVTPEEEAARVVPVVSALARAGLTVSIDTRNAAVMSAAAEAGAAILNDVTALEGEGSLETAARLQLPVILMHMQGSPGTMQANPVYGDVVAEVRDYLLGRARACEAAGLGAGQIAIDPGIGFGKTVDHNMALLRATGAFVETGYPVLIGVSRKSFIGKLAGIENPKDRLAGSIASALATVAQGAAILRVHDVAETVQACKVWTALGVRM
ncbi:MAG: dihydropteroate synthase [Magnetovibrionaceae bacterium]